VARVVARAPRLDDPDPEPIGMRFSGPLTFPAFFWFARSGFLFLTALGRLPFATTSALAPALAAGFGRPGLPRPPPAWTPRDWCAS